MTSLSQIRATFLDYFKKNGHEVRPSSSLVPHNDPTLMFTNAGMNQFKNVFTGAEKLPYSRAATSQKCVRAGGKHNDLDNVGYTARHHTFFEMLGNFSFGDYFKEEAIHHAWNLLTKDYGLNPEKLCVTVYHDDDAAWNIWKKLTGFADHKIIRIASSDNFWSMGDTGPCGPCSEIFYDHGTNIDGGPPGSPNQDGDRFVEIWNLVFMQYEQLEGGKRINLPKPSIDTGMGLERITAVMQGVHDNYSTDLFKYLIADIAAKAGSGGEPAAYKVIADHLRSSCFLMADGVMPSNEGRGYVLRRIMRRAMRYAHQLGCKDPLMYQLVPALVKEMGGQYPELIRAQAVITENLKQEEERFKETLGRGLKLLEEETEKLVHGQSLPGDAAFKLYDTYGFPLDLTQDILKSRGITVDTDGFEKAMEGQREMARAAHKGSGDVATSRIWFELKEKIGSTQFLGYDQDEAQGKVLAIVSGAEEVAGAKAGDEVFIVLSQTPFYGESGGQVGDTGRFTNIAEIVDTQKPLEDFIVHQAKLTAPLSVGDVVHAVIDTNRRNRIRSNHSVTHLLHKALRDKLGAHVTQKGSLVADDRLRFDISHPKAVGAEELAWIETAVNEVVARGGAVDCREMAPEAAIEAGAMALFGEKYGDKVRVLSIGKQPDGSAYSVELCGGTHVRDTADIQLFKITSEGSVAAGIRRIEATTGENVRRFWLDRLQELQAKAQALHADHLKLHHELAEVQTKLGKINSIKSLGAVSVDAAQLKQAPLSGLTALASSECSKLEQHLTTFQEENRKLNKLLADAKKQLALGSDAEAKPETIGAYQFIGKAFDGLDPKELRYVANGYLKQADIVAVMTQMDGKASVVVGVNKPHSEKISAVALVQAAVAELGGKGGGGKPDMAQGGGPDVAKIDAAMAKITALLA